MMNSFPEWPAKTTLIRQKELENPSVQTLFVRKYIKK